MLLKYIGPKSLPYVVETPIPLLRKTDKTGEIVFNPEADVPDAWARWLLDRQQFQLVRPTFKRRPPIRDGRGTKRSLAILNEGRYFPPRHGPAARSAAQCIVIKYGLQGLLEARRVIPCGGYVLLTIPATAGGENPPISVIPPEGQGGSHERRSWKDTEPIHRDDLDRLLKERGSKFRNGYNGPTPRSGRDRVGQRVVRRLRERRLKLEGTPQGDQDGRAASEGGVQTPSEAGC